MMNDDNKWAWLAGFLEGEGSFQIVKAHPPRSVTTYNPQISATNCGLMLVDRCKKIAGGHILGPHGLGHERYKPSYRWVLKGRGVGPTIERLMPFLILKREQAEILLLFRSEVTIGSVTGSFGRARAQDSLRQRRETMKLALHALNHRGVSPIPQEQTDALVVMLAELEQRRQTSQRNLQCVS